MSHKRRNPHAAGLSLRPLEVTIETNLQDDSPEESAGKVVLSEQDRGEPAADLLSPWLRDADSPETVFINRDIAEKMVDELAGLREENASLQDLVSAAQKGRAEAELAITSLKKEFQETEDRYLAHSKEWVRRLSGVKVLVEGISVGGDLATHVQAEEALKHLEEVLLLIGGVR